MKKLSMNTFLLLSLFLLFSAGTADAKDINLIVRGDDMGMTQGSLLAFERAFNQGVLTCASIVVPGPWFEAAAQLCSRNPGWCTGVHLCLVGEWRGMRWRPVLPWNQLSSLVDEDGYLYAYPDQLFAQKPQLEEIEAELRAQIELARKKGINVQYLDTHYMDPNNPGYPGLREIIEKIAGDYNLPVSGMLDEQKIGIYSVPIADRKKEAMSMLESLEPGLWLWICHPGIDSPEQRALIHTAAADIKIEGVGKRRAEILNILTGLELKSVILKRGIKLTDYRQIWRDKK